GRKIPVRMPFQMGYIPPGLQVIESREKQGMPFTQKWAVSLTLGRPASASASNSDSEDGDAADRDAQVSIDVVPMSAGDPHDESGPVNTTVDGHPAARKTITIDPGTSELLRVLDVQGFAISITTSGVGRQAPERISHGLRLLGSDRAVWTTRPVG